MTWVLTILGIVLLIILHEFGHFVVAKLVGMRVERFSLFFPPTIARVRRGETEYAIGAIPAGGYVKITGMNPEELGGMDPEVARRAYYAQPPWKRIAVIFAGPAVNILIAFLLFWGVLLSGNLSGAVKLQLLDESVHAVHSTTAIQGTEPGRPAAGVLHKGDRIVSVEGMPATVAATQRAIETHRCAGTPVNGCSAATPVHIVVRRGSRDISLALRPRYDAAEHRMRLGFFFGTAARHFGPLAAASASVREMWHVTVQTITGFGKALTNSKTRGEVSSIVGITASAQEQVKAGAGDALVFLGYLSLILAVINLFPFLPLDGGHVLWSLAEKVRGKRVSIAAMWRFSSVGILLLAFLVLNGISNDISRLTG